MMIGLNAEECTLRQFIGLVDSTGWKLVSISHSSKDAMALFTFEPVDL
jgi:hypothetical protein